MEKILDISGSFSNFCGEYLDDDCIIGRIILDNNNRFEGVIEKLFLNDSYFVFGHLDSEQIDFIIGNDEVDEVPKRIVVYKDKNFFAGSYSAKDIYSEIPMGESRIRIYPADQTREVSNFEISTLKNEIMCHKEKLGERTKELYVAYISETPKEKTIGQK